MGPLTETDSAVSCGLPAAGAKRGHLWLVVTHTDTFSEVTIPAVPVVALLAFAESFFTVSKIKESQRVDIPEDFLLNLRPFASHVVSLRCNLPDVNLRGWWLFFACLFQTGHGPGQCPLVVSKSDLSTKLRASLSIKHH